MLFRERTRFESGSIFTASFDSGKDVLDRGRLALVRAHADPADFSLTPDDKRRTPREIDGVYSESLIDTIGTRYLSLLIEQDAERVGVFLDVLLSLEEPVDLLRCYEYNACVALCELGVSGLKLSQLVLAVRSPCAADEYKRNRLSAIIGKPHDRAICRGELKAGRRIAGLEGSRRCSQHCYNFDLSASIL